MSIAIDRLEKLGDQLKEIIFDQGHTIDLLIKIIKRAHFTYRRESDPFSILFLSGPTHSGKKFLSAQMAQCLSYRYKVFSMDQYILSEDAERLCNSLKKEGEIANFIHTSPLSIILFDEIDKAHNHVQTCLSHFLQEGHDDINMSECIIIFSSNLGKACYFSQNYQTTTIKDSIVAEFQMLDFLSNETKNSDELITNAFSPHFINFILNNGSLVFLNKRKFDTLKKISINLLATCKKQIEKKLNQNIIINDFDIIATFLLLSFYPCVTTGNVSYKFTQTFIDLIIQSILENEKKFSSIVITVKEDVRKTYIDNSLDLNLTIKKMRHSNEIFNLDWICCEEKDELKIILNSVNFYTINFNKVFQISDPVIEYALSGLDAVAGQQAVKKTLQEIIRLIKTPDLLLPFNIKVPNGMVLYGPKGIGKTQLAQAFAFEANIPFIKIAGIDLFDQEKIRYTYMLAKESSPCVVILDELDQKGIVSSIPFYQINSYFNLEGVLTIATVKDLEDIPAELMVPGALDLIIEVRELDKEARKFFIEKIFKMPHEDKIDIEKVAAYMTGMNGHDLQRISSQTALSALIQRSEIITEELLIEQINKIKYGEKIELKRIKNPKEEIIMTAYHEAGHAVLSIMLLPQIIIEQVTVAPRSEALGFVSYKDEDFVSTATKDEIFKNLCVLMAGRVIKLKKFGPGGIDSGDVTDIGQATLEAYAAIAHLGMDDELGYINILSLSESIAGSFLKEKIERRVSFWLNDAKNTTEELVERYWDVIEIVAEKLIEKEMLSGDELVRIVHNVQIKDDIQGEIYPIQT